MSPQGRASLAGAGFAYMPLLLLAGSALRPNAALEGLLVGIGAAGLGGLTLVLARGWWAGALACAVTVGAYAIDMVTGSELTKLSLLGPNPIYGARFFGIGNELEALFAVMVPVGVGAGLSADRLGKGVGPICEVAGFLGVGILAGLVFGTGRFGADVGAAIVLPVGAVVAAAVPAGTLRLGDHGRGATTDPHRLSATALAVFARRRIRGRCRRPHHRPGFGRQCPADALGARRRWGSDLADTAERRLRLSAHDFGQAAANPSSGSWPSGWPESGVGGAWTPSCGPRRSPAQA